MRCGDNQFEGNEAQAFSEPAVGEFGLADHCDLIATDAGFMRLFDDDFFAVFQQNPEGLKGIVI